MINYDFFFISTFLLVSSSNERRGILLQYFAKSADIKKKAVCKYIDDLLEGNCKFLVFAHHKVNLNEK